MPEGTDTISCSATELHIWIGAVACGLDVYIGATPSDYVSTFTPPELSAIMESGLGGLEWCHQSVFAPCLKSSRTLTTDTQINHFTP